jgi:hypothetical protein
MSRLYAYIGGGVGPAAGPAYRLKAHSSISELRMHPTDIQTFTICFSSEKYSKIERLRFKLAPDGRDFIG